MTLPTDIAPNDVGHINDHEEIHFLLSSLQGQTAWLATGWRHGTSTERPPASVANKGLFYYSTDETALFYSDGSAWRGTVVSEGASARFGSGSVIFGGATGALSEDNANFFWDDLNNRLHIGPRASGSGPQAAKLVVYPATGESPLVLRNAGNTSTLFEVTQSKSLFGAQVAVDITNGRIGVGTQSPNFGLHLTGSSPRRVIFQEAPSAGVLIEWARTDAALNEKRWGIELGGAATVPALSFNARSDDETAATDWLRVERGTGINIASINFFPAVSIGKILAHDIVLSDPLLLHNPSTGTEIARFTAAGQLQLLVAGSAGGILIGGDTNVYRSAADVLQTDDEFRALRVNAPVRRLIGYWYQDNVAANQTNVALNLNGNASRSELVTIRSGSVTGIVVRSNEARATGTLTVEVTINGVGTGLTAVLDATNTTAKATTQDPNLDTYNAGDRIGVRITTDNLWTPTTADITVMVEVLE